jgi:dTDP-4-dehydrorhamnose reductase
MILVLGKNGQLSRALAGLLGADARLIGRDEADLSKPGFTQNLTKISGGIAPRAVINAAAYTQVDKAEGEGRAEAMQVNGAAVAELAQWCKERDIPLLHFSTDYVFDGSGRAPRNEQDTTSPVNAYGQSKLVGENSLAECGGKYLLFRTSWVYDAHGKNFFNTILRLIGEKENLKVVSDQVGAPTYAPHLAAAAVNALNNALTVQQFPSGLYHLCGGGETSWHGFANAIFALARTRDSGVRCQRIDPIPTTEYPLPAKRPLNSRLDCGKAKKILGVSLPDWQVGLKECFEEKYGR